MHKHKFEYMALSRVNPRPGKALSGQTQDQTNSFSRQTHHQIRLSQVKLKTIPFLGCPNAQNPRVPT